ncbi:Kiwa anti-phage protein KwaB-like domain-containing protein [Kurthia populi]|uniref:Kiwa anti-phage protein KwaB-like domain-containing protein n=1 Tax=Kurthia populi TaxID=1562132 RepID=A0ABW5XZI9_9BACL
MELYIFFKSKEMSPTDNLIDIDYFRYPNIDHNLALSMKSGLEKINEKLDFSDATEYNPLSIEREKKIEKISLEEQKENSEYFVMITKIILENELVSHVASDNEKTYRFRNVRTFNNAQYPIFFYVIKLEGKVYFKKSSDSILMMENRKKIILKRDTAEKVDMEDFMSIDMNYDFLIDSNTIYIKNGHGFEQILRYDDVLKTHKNIIIDKIETANVIENFTAFKDACNNAKYYRAFKKIPQDLDFKAAFLNEDFLGFLEGLEIKTNGNIKWNSEINKVELVDIHIKTVLHMFNGLIGKDIYGEFVMFNERFSIPN